MRFCWMGILGFLISAVAGCGGGSKLEPVSGTVQLDGKALPDVAVIFMPDADTKGPKGTGVTGADGKYELMSAQGKQGVAPGKYKVTIAKVNKYVEGGPAVVAVGIKDQLPGIYSDPIATKLTATVEPGKPVDFTLKSKP